MSEVFVFNVRVRNKSSGLEKIFKYSCVANCETAARIKTENVVKSDLKFDFVSAELKERKEV